jgi:very-short-patch-repair endonuclease
MKRVEFLSDLERTFAAMLDSNGVEYIPNQPLRTGFIADFLLPDKNIIIEVDGHRSHFTKQGKQKKRFRDYMLRRSGYKVVHLTAEQSGDFDVVNKMIQEAK